MPNTYFCSDWHFGHAKTTDGTFKRDDGITNLRPFKDVDEMNSEIIRRHNSVVSPSDFVWFLGDAVINKKFLGCISSLNGIIKMVRGNHDVDKNLKDYFQGIYATREMSDMILSHIPINGACVNRWKSNVHGHQHGNQSVNDPRFLCVSMEDINYTPISLDEVRSRIIENHKVFQYTKKVIDFSDPARYK